MSKLVKAQAKMQKARARAEAETDTARAKAERKVAKVRADLAVTEAKIQARLEKALGKGDRKLLAQGGRTRARAADVVPTVKSDPEQGRSAKRQP